MSDEMRFSADAADIRSLLAGTDPAADTPGAETSGRLSRIRDGITSTDSAAAQSTQKARMTRAWWPNLPVRRRQRRTIVIYAVIPALLAVTGAAWAVTSSSSTPSGNVFCYSSASLHPSGILGGVVSKDQTPVAFCASKWAIGAVTGDPHSHTVPPLVACVAPAAIGVFPHTTCAALGLQPLSARYLRAAQHLATLSAYLARRINLSTCMAEPRAAEIARQALTRYGYHGWRVTGYRPDPVAECATMGVNNANHTVFLIGLPGPNSPGARYDAVFQRLNAHCTPGSKPVSARKLIRGMLAALRAEGYPGWTVVVSGAPTSRKQPCYTIGWNGPRHELLLLSVSKDR